jgi:sugar phosphate isomerase/epimerase
MKVGTIHHVSYPFIGGDESQKLVSLKKLLTDGFFEAIEVGHFYDPLVRLQAIGMLRAAHVEAIAFGGQGITLGAGLNVNDLDDAKRNKAVRALKEGIDEAYEFGASYFAFLAGRYSEDTVEQSYQALVSSIRELSAYTRQKGGMGLEIEVFDFDIEKRSLIGPVDRVVRLAEEICPEFDNFSIQIDSSHIPLLHETIEQSVLPVRPYLRHAHMGNAVMHDPSFPGYGDNHPRFGYPHGENDTRELADYLRVLLDCGFLNEKDRPILSFEVKPQPGEDPDLVLAGAKRTLMDAWRLV